jgi:hypothetical protein
LIDHTLIGTTGRRLGWLVVTLSSARSAAIEDAGPIGEARRVAADGDPVTIQLSRDEALALFERLHRSEGQDGVSPPEHHAEQVALWTLSALLERELVAPFQQHYRQLVEEARERLACDGQA